MYIEINRFELKSIASKILALTLPCLIFYACSNNELIPPSEESVSQYLADNQHEISLEFNTDLTSEFGALADHFEGKELILLGENHASQFNEVIDTKLFQYLYHQHGVRVYIAESSIGMAYYINRYINTGYEFFLDYVMANYSGSFSQTLHNRARLVRLKDFNLSLPEGERITYIGIDVEHQVTVGFRVFKQLVPQATIEAPHPEELTSIIYEINNTSYSNYLAVVNAAPYFLEALTTGENTEGFKAYFPDYEQMVLILEGIITKVSLEENPLTFDTKREQQIARNLAFAKQKYAGEKLYGKWGASHIWKRQLSDNYKTFVQEAIEAKTISVNAVASIPIFYFNSSYTDKDNDFAPRPITFNTAPAVMRVNEESPVVLFDLNEQGSPFNNFMMLIKGVEGTTTSYFDLAFYFNGSLSSKPYTL